MKRRRDINQAIENIQNRKIDDVNIQGVGNERISGSGQTIAGSAPQGQVTTAKYADPKQAAGYIQGLQKQLGISGPKSAIDATRNAATRTLDEQTYQASLQDANTLASQGQTTGARSQALSVLRGQTLAGQKAQLEADLQQDEADKMQAYESQLLGMAQGQGAQLTSAEQRAAEAETRGSFTNAQAQAQRQLQQARYKQANH